VHIEQRFGVVCLPYRQFLQQMRLKMTANTAASESTRKDVTSEGTFRGNQTPVKTGTKSNMA
jgi:hypothetical protein